MAYEPVRIGQQTMASSSPVVIASDQSAIPVSAASLPLPTGAATLAEQQTQTASLSVLDDWDESDRAKVNPIVGQAGVAGGTGVDGATVQRVSLATNVPLPAGTNAIGKLSANSGVDIGDVDVTSVIPGVGATNLGKTEDTVHASGDTGVFTLAVANEAQSTLAADGDYISHVTDTKGNNMVVGNIAHDGVDAGNPIKIGGKVTTSVPTTVANADRVDSWHDQWGRQVISDQDVELGLTIGTTGLRDRLMVQRCTILSDSLADGIAGFWTQSTAGGGTILSTGGAGVLSTSTGATGSAQIVSTNVAYYPGQVAWLNSAVVFGDTGTAGNIRRLGMFTVSGTTPQEGFYYELNGTTLNAVTVKAGTPTAVASTSWSRFAVAPFTLTTDYVSLEIRYTANTVWFYVNNVLRHVVSGTTTSLTTSLTLPITVTNVKTSGATDITLGVRNIGNGRFGQNGGTVNETGLSAVETIAVGGGTPHDSVDSGNPLKIGGKANSGTPTAVAIGDRTDAWMSLNGALNIAASGTNVATGSGTATGAMRVELPTNGTGVIGSVTAFGAGTAGPMKAEDAASSNGDQGVAMMVRRFDTPVANAGVSLDGDYTTPIMDNFGKLWVTGSYFEDTVHTAADPLLAAATRRIDTPASSAGTSGDYATLDSNEVGALWSTPTPSINGGTTVYHLVSAATTNATVVKASRGTLIGWYIYNSNAAARKLAFHNTASTPTAGASVYFSLVIPPTSGANVLGGMAIDFSTGIGITTVTGLADNDSAAVALNDLVINLFYK